MNDPTGWAEKTSKFLDQFMQKCDDPDCEGCQYDHEAVIEHITELLATQKREIREGFRMYIFNKIGVHKDADVQKFAKHAAEAMANELDKFLDESSGL